MFENSSLIVNLINKPGIMGYRLNVLLAILLCNSIWANDNKYHFFIDLNKAADHSLYVNLTPPAFQSDEVIYHMPAIVPGTYAIYDFGRFISNFTVTDNDGKEIPVERIDINSWKIPRAKSIAKIRYEVGDTWSSEIKEAFVFEPGGTNIEKDKNFVINTHGYFGYFEGYKQNSFELEFEKPQKFYGSTALIADKNTATNEQYTVNDYMRLVDSPIMFCVPDTTTLNIGGAKILISVYSSKKGNSSSVIAKNIEAVLKAQKDYLGGKLPIDKYAFIIYLYAGIPKSSSYGALEHSYSSFYVLPEMEATALARSVRDFAAHEFFHIITPLSIHSEEIGNFDYNNPKMSRHLWMYEGITEYFAGHAQVTQGLLKFEDYVDVLQKKIRGKESYNDTLPFTTMSLGCLDKYKDQYDNVYEKGALIGLCLDIKLRSLSAGQYGVQNMMNDLAKTYGKDKSFKDEELFMQIVMRTYPQIGEFLNTYVDGNKPLPLAEMLNKVGIDYKETGITHEVSPLGGITPAYDPTAGFFYIATESYKNINSFGKSIGLNVGDDLLKLNGKKLTIENVETVLGDYYSRVKEGDMLKLLVVRKDDKGKEHKIKLKTKIVAIDFPVNDVLTINKNPDEKQLALRQFWLGQRKF